MKKFSRLKFCLTSLIMLSILFFQVPGVIEAKASSSTNAAGPQPICNIGGAIFQNGQKNGPCQVCNSSSSQTAWSNISDGTRCGNDEFCTNGACSAGCFIWGTYYQPHAPNGPCQICQPSSLTTAGSTTWTNVSDGASCGQAQVCSGGLCVKQTGSASSAVPSTCTIGGISYQQNVYNPNNPCQMCLPSTSTKSWTAVENGSSCGVYGVNCVNGTCETGGCTIDGLPYPPGGENQRLYPCSVCNPAISTTAWSYLSDGATCNNGNFCVNGTCSPGCVIGGTYYQVNAAHGPCQSCLPVSNSTITAETWTNLNTWTNAKDGTSCGPTGQVCFSGTCVAQAGLSSATPSPAPTPSPKPSPTQSPAPTSSVSASAYGYELSNQRINTQSYSNASGNLTLTDADLAQGQINITARLATLDKVATMLISEDNGRTWNSIATSQDISYSITPIPNKLYQPLLKIKTTDIQEVVITIFPNIDGIIYQNIDYDKLVMKAVKTLADSYEMRDLGQFSDLISGDFQGDKAALENGVRFDFELFTNIHLVIYIDRIENRNGTFIADTNWEKIQTPISAGGQQNSTGQTVMVFDLEGGQLKLLNLKGNLIYATLSPDIAETSGLSAAIVAQIRTAEEQRDPIQPGAATTSGSSSTTSITITSPHSGDSWPIGTPQQIDWYFSGSISYVKLEYSVNGGSTWTTITSSTPANNVSSTVGDYTWTVPSPTTFPSVIVRVTDVSDPSVSSTSGIFAIV